MTPYTCKAVKFVEARCDELQYMNSPFAVKFVEARCDELQYMNSPFMSMFD